MRNALLLSIFSALLVLMLVLGVFCPAAGAAETAAFDRSAAVILAYQRVGEDLYPATSISTEKFSAHIDELTEGGYHIAPMDEVIAAIQSGNRLPDKTIVITFDGAYQSALMNAVPLLQAKKIPFTVFFSPGQADTNNPDYMGWDDLKNLARDSSVTMGLHSADYTRLTDAPADELRRQVNNATTRYREQLKMEPAYFSFPFGEYSKEYRGIIAASGFKAGFGQQSGVAWSGSDIFVLPRFSMTESYADDERFKMAASALPLPATDIAPDDPRITTTNPPDFGFTVDAALAAKLPLLSCFISEQGTPAMQIVGKNRVELRVEKPFEDDRVRVNCTMPGPQPQPGEDQRWRWFGMLLTVGQISTGLEDDYAPSAGD